MNPSNAPARGTVDTTDAQLALGIGTGATSHEGMGDHERSSSGNLRARSGQAVLEHGGVGHPAPPRRLIETAQHRAAPASTRSPSLVGWLDRWIGPVLVAGRHHRVEVRNEDELELAVVEHERLHCTGPPVATGDVQTVGQQPVEGRHPLGTVVVPGDQRDAGASGPDCLQAVTEDHHGVVRWDRPVVHVAGDDDEIDALDRDELDDAIEHAGLVVEQRVRPEGPPEVPIAGVEDPHDLRR